MVPEIARMIVVYVVAYVFREVMVVMGRKEIGNLIKITAITVIVGWGLEMIMHFTEAVSAHPIAKALVKIGEAIERLPLVGLDGKYRIP